MNEIKIEIEAAGYNCILKFSRNNTKYSIKCKCGFSIGNYISLKTDGTAFKQALIELGILDGKKKEPKHITNNPMQEVNYE